MGAKRRKSRTGKGDENDQKRQKLKGNTFVKEPVVKRALLAQYYCPVLTLREYLLSKLPSTSKVRRKKIRSCGCKSQRGVGEDERELSSFLDQTLVGVSRHDLSADNRRQQWTAFSQRADESVSTLSNLSGIGQFSQSEVRLPPLNPPIVL